MAKNQGFGVNKKLQVIGFNEDNLNTPFPGLIIPNKIKLNSKDVLRIQSQLIKGFISGKVEGQKAKDLSYLTSTYLQTLQTVDLENRLDKLELRIQPGKK